LGSETSKASGINFQKNAQLPIGKREESFGWGEDSFEGKQGRVTRGCKLNTLEGSSKKGEKKKNEPPSAFRGHPGFTINSSRKRKSQKKKGRRKRDIFCPRGSKEESSRSWGKNLLQKLA